MRTVLNCFLGLSMLVVLVGCTGGSQGTPMDDNLQAKRDVASYLEEMYDTGAEEGFSLNSVKEKCKYIEMDVEKISSKAADVTSFKELLEKLKKSKSEEEVKELCLKMAKFLEIPEMWQTSFLKKSKS
jgi:hypothetical protein